MNKLFENEQMFKQVRAKISAATLYLGSQEFPRDLVLKLYCECTNPLCMGHIKITYEKYRSAKTDSLAFVIKPEHYLPEHEQLVGKTVSYWVIIKIV